MAEAIRRDAATVVLLRDRRGSGPGDSGLEVLLMARPASARFAAGAEVFPGGTVEPSDRDPSWSEVSAGPLSDQRLELGILVAAVRECFEESGVLLARDAGGGLCRRSQVAALAELRRRIHDRRPEEFREGLLGAGLRPAWEDLVYCAHWVTPEGLPRIFDTRFFLAALPLDQEPLADELGELDSLRWVGPAQAMAEAIRGDCLLLPPTRAVLEQLTVQPTVAAALAAAAKREVGRVQPPLEEITEARYPGLDPRTIFRAHRGEG